MPKPPTPPEPPTVATGDDHRHRQLHAARRHAALRAAIGPPESTTRRRLTFRLVLELDWHDGRRLQQPPEDIAAELTRWLSDADGIHPPINFQLEYESDERDDDHSPFAFGALPGRPK